MLERLGIFATKLGIDRVSFLRLLGMSLDDARKYQVERDWDSIVTMVGKERAQRLEGLLVQLLSRYSSDWHALLQALHNDTPPQLLEQSREQREAVPSDRILLRWIINGGPGSVPALRDYLATQMKAQVDH